MSEEAAAPAQETPWTTELGNSVDEIMRTPGPPREKTRTACYAVCNALREHGKLVHYGMPNPGVVFVKPSGEEVPIERVLRAIGIIPSDPLSKAIPQYLAAVIPTTRDERKP
jgi:hypothetical protein